MNSLSVLMDDQQDLIKRLNKIKTVTRPLGIHIKTN